MGSRFLRPSVVVLAGALIAAAPGAGADKGAVVSDAPLQRSGGHAGQAFVPGELIVQFRTGASTAARTSALRTRGASFVQGLGQKGLMLVKLPEGASVTAAAQAFEDDPTVEFAEPNNISHLTATLPNDPRFGDLWGLNQAADHDIDAPEAWDLNTGSGSVIVAVIDSGVSYTHPDLAPNIWINDDPAGGGDNDGNGKVDDTRGWDFVQEDNTPLDFNGHGTHVAGTIGAQGNNAVGITGVNWDVSIMPLRAADAFGGLTDADIAQAITYACAERRRRRQRQLRRARSRTPPSRTRSIRAACANTLFVFAAGNDGDNLELNGPDNDSFPCEYHRSPAAGGVSATNVLCVAATTGERHAGRASRTAATRPCTWPRPGPTSGAPSRSTRCCPDGPTASRARRPRSTRAGTAASSPRARSSGTGPGPGSPARSAWPTRRAAATTTTRRPRSAG